jgi:hypothetical protein
MTLTLSRHVFFTLPQHRVPRRTTRRTVASHDYPPAIMCFAFGRGPNDSTHQPTPGGTNRALAWSVCALLRTYTKHHQPRPLVLAQHEIERALVGEFDERVTAAVRGNLDTCEVARRFAWELTNRSPRTTDVLVVAHPDHAARCAAAISTVGLRPVSTRYLRPTGGGIPWLRYECNQCGYWRKSTQPWTRTRKVYLRHDLRARRQCAQVVRSRKR